MSLTSLGYDKAEYLAKHEENNTIVNHIFDINRHENCNVCADKPNSVNLGDKTSLESNLQGHDRVLCRDDSCKHQKGAQVNQLNHLPPFLCERTLSHPSFIDQGNRNNYMNELKKGQ